jgi:hypothetical protein
MAPYRPARIYRRKTAPGSAGHRACRGRGGLLSVDGWAGLPVQHHRRHRGTGGAGRRRRAGQNAGVADAGAITERASEHLRAGADQVALTILNTDADQPGPAEAARQLAGFI